MFSAKKFMTSIDSLNVDCTIPSQVSFGPAPTIPNSFAFGPAPMVEPASFSFGPAPMVEPASFSFGPAPAVGPASYQFGPAPTLPSTVSFAPAPSVSVSWGPTPSISVNINGIINKTPATASAAGNPGDICWDSGYIYVCTDQNSWKRAALSAW